MSDYSGSGSDTDSDYDAQTEGHVGSVGSGTQVESGTGNTSSLNETQGNDLPLPKVLAQFAKGTINPKKPLLIYVTKVVSSTIRKPGRKRGGSRNWTCNICGHPWVGGYSRVKQHLLGIGGKGVTICEELSLVQRSELLRIQVAADAKGTFSSQNVTSETHQNVEAATSSKRKSKGKKSSMGLMPPPSPGDSGISSSKHKGSCSCALGPTIAGMYSKLNRDDTDDAIGKFLFANGIPFHVSRSPYYKEMVKAIATAGSSYVPPGEHKLRTVILDRQVSNITMHKEQMRQTWVREGCSIVMDGWTDIAKRPLINIIVTCREGPFFLRAIDCSGKRKDAAFQFELLRDAIEEVGPINVVQVVTDAAAVCRSAGLLIQDKYRHIFWTPCCVHALNNALKDIGKIEWVSSLVTTARNVQMFICNHHTSLAMYRSHSRKEFLKPTKTRYASYFLLLERMLEVQPALQAMVVTPEWSRWAESKTDEGKKIRVQILDNDWWTDCGYLVSLLRPIVEVICYTDIDSPSLGEIYETFDSMLGQVKVAIREKDPSLEFYTTQIRPIIQRRWDRMNTPLHMEAYALNPKWYVERPGRILPIEDPEVKKGFRVAITKMYNAKEGKTLRRQWMQFASLNGPFNKSDAREDCNDLGQDDPIGWWTKHRGDAPEI